MRRNADKRTKWAQQRYNRHHSAQVQEKTGFHVSKLVYIDCAPLSTSAADKMAAEAYFKLLPCALGPYRVTSTISHSTNIDPNGTPITIFSNQALLAPAHMLLQDDIVDDQCNHSLSGHSVNTSENTKTNHGKAKIKEINRRNILSFILSDMSSMAAKESMWCDDMATRHVTARWNHLSTMHNT